MGILQALIGKESKETEQLRKQVASLLNEKSRLQDELKAASRKRAQDGSENLRELTETLSSREQALGAREATLLELLASVEKREALAKAAEDDASQRAMQLEEARRDLRTGKRELTNAAAALAASEDEARRLAKRLTTSSRKHADEKESLEKTLSGISAIAGKDILAWMLRNLREASASALASTAILDGEGPHTIKDLGQIVYERGICPLEAGFDRECDVLVLGRHGFDEKLIRSQIEAREPRQLRVYSQELLLAGLVLDTDPLEVLDEETLLASVEDHPAFALLFSMDFPWPPSEPLPDEPTEWGLTTAKESPLRKLGYNVDAKEKLSASQRRSLLRQAFEADPLPRVESDEYMAAWGGPKSRRRLHRMAWHLYLLSKMHQHHLKAMKKWQGDLAWLKEEFRSISRRFKWPGDA